MILLMRHGADDSSRLGGWSDAKLSEDGIEQVRRASEKLAQFDVRHIFASDLVRAKETAEIVAERLSLHITFQKEFREANNGDLAGLLKEKARIEYPGLYWSALDWEQPYPNGESPALFHERVKNAWVSFKKAAESLDGDILLVTHGSVIDVILCYENGKPYTNTHQTYAIGNAETACIF